MPLKVETMFRRQNRALFSAKETSLETSVPSKVALLPMEPGTGTQFPNEGSMLCVEYSMVNSRMVPVWMSQSASLVCIVVHNKDAVCISILPIVETFPRS